MQIETHEEPKRFAADYASWRSWTEDERQRMMAEWDKEMDAVGVVILSAAMSPEQCDRFVALIDEEIRGASKIEKQMNENRLSHKGYTVYNLQGRHPLFLEHIAYPPIVDYFRRFLGESMALHSSEARVTPHGTGDAHWHYDGYDRIPDYFLSMNSLHYLCDSTEENGATRYIPGTHKSFLPVEEAKRLQHRYLNVKKGDIVLFNPYLIHSGSANLSGKPRPIVINYYQRSYIKQEFDYYHMLGYMERRKLTDEQKKLLGFDHFTAADIHELYMISKGDNKLEDMNPYA
ncbi:MAG: phytanoyl-CoA dioxygenase family protein [Paenibacillaceae bacterium]|nr:phytanoyl-CoA dioxygenase family protein [Paenibacillaceae bacterium]